MGRISHEASGRKVVRKCAAKLNVELRKAPGKTQLSNERFARYEGLGPVTAVHKEGSESRPSVTVLVPCYNYGRFLKQCVGSVLTQSGVDVRVIVVDDASTDDSAEVAAALARQDSRVRLISLRQNLGMIPAVNLGLQEIDDDYFVKLDADDLLTPGSLERSVALLETFPNVGFVYGWARHFTGDVPRCASSGHRRWTAGALAEWLATRGSPNFTVWPGTDWLELRYRRALNCIRQPEAVIRRSALKRVGEYNPKLPHTSDLEMWLRLAATSDVARINRGDQGYYRVHPDSMQHTVNSGLLTDLTGRRNAFLSDALTASKRHSGQKNLEEIVRNELAVQALVAACAAFDARRELTVPVDQLVEFATVTFPPIVTSPQWRRLERRRRRNGRNGWTPPALIASTMLNTRGMLRYFRWMRTGV